MSFSSIPDINEIRSQSAINREKKLQECENFRKNEAEKANLDCNYRIQQAAKRGEEWAECKSWISESYLELMKKKGYNARLVVQTDFDDVDYYNISWEKQHK